MRKNKNKGEKQTKMKKYLIFTLTLLLLLGSGFTAAAASLGSGVAAVAETCTMIKTGLIGQKMNFSDSDFKVALGLTDFERITVTAVPASTEGSLLLGGRRVGVGQTVRRRNLAALAFLPASADLTECEMKFTCEEYAGGEEITCKLRFVDKINYAPKLSAETSAKAMTTQAGVPLYGKLSAKDPEGDALEYLVVSYPKRGTLTSFDTKSGSFRYTPSGSFVGNDVFCYVVRDCYGNYTELARAQITVEKRRFERELADMKNSPAYAAALTMVGAGIMEAKAVGDDLYFLPDEHITRAEFVTMALKAKGIRADSTLGATFFDDNDKIPASLVPYIATAQRLGIVNGDFDGHGLYFRPNDEITKAEAAVVLKNLSDDVPTEALAVFAEEDSLPVWAKVAVYSMYALGIFEKGDTPLDPAEKVTRADAAGYLLF